MPNRNSVKRPRARRFWSPQSNKKNKCVGEIFLNNSMFREKSNYTIIETLNLPVLLSTNLCEY